MRLALILALTLAAAGCTTVPPEARMAYLKVVAEPENTTVYESDRFVSSAHQ